MDKIWDRKSFEVGGHWPLWRGWTNRMATQNLQKSNAKKTNSKYSITWVIRSTSGPTLLQRMTNEMVATKEVFRFVLKVRGTCTTNWNSFFFAGYNFCIQLYVTNKTCTNMVLASMTIMWWVGVGILFVRLYYRFCSHLYNIPMYILNIYWI